MWTKNLLIKICQWELQGKKPEIFFVPLLLLQEVSVTPILERLLIERYVNFRKSAYTKQSHTKRSHTKESERSKKFLQNSPIQNSLSFDLAF